MLGYIRLGQAKVIGKPADGPRAERQLVEIARALLLDPHFLLLDEPGAHLDPAGFGTVEPLIGRSSGATRVVVTHDVDGGLADADRALALHSDGSVAYEGPAGGLSPEDARAIYSWRAK